MAAGADSTPTLPATFVENLVKLRHELHSHPETGFREAWTRIRLISRIEGMGVPKESIRGPFAETGFIVDVAGEGEECEEGRVVALRTDIDALPMTEANPDLEYRSKEEGAAHMCGHDGHMTCLLGALEVIWENRSKLPSNCTVRFLFQPAEEGTDRGGGAEPMVAEGVLEGVDEVYGFHNWPAFELGDVHVKSGPVMAAVTDLDVEIRGTGVHASQPHAGRDAVVAAAHVLVALQTIVSRSSHSADEVVVSVCKLNAGESRNVLPDSVKLSGTIRTLTPSSLVLVKRRVEEIASHTAAAHGCEAHVKLHDLYPALVNQPSPSETVRTVGCAILGEEHVKADRLPVLGGEDFAFFTQTVPGCYFFVGTRQDGHDESMLHASTFDFNDAAIPIAINMYLGIVEDRCKAHGLREAAQSHEPITKDA